MNLGLQTIDRRAYKLHKLQFRSSSRGSNDAREGLEPIPHAPPSLRPLRASGGRNGDLLCTQGSGGKAVLKKIAEQARQSALKEKSGKPISFRPKASELEQLRQYMRAMNSHGESHMAAVCFRVGLATLIQLEKEGAL